MKSNHYYSKALSYLLIAAFVFIGSSLTIKQKHIFASSEVNHCAIDTSSWDTFSNTGGTLASGNYVLESNIELLDNITITTGTVNIDLNGYILKGHQGSNKSIFTVTGGTLNIYDCPTEQRIHSYKIKEVYPTINQDIYANNPSYSNKLFQRYYDFDEIGDGVIIGGIITGGHKFSNASNLASNFSYKGGGSAILIGGTDATVNFYGGSISGNSVTALSQWGSKRERSGTVGIFDGGTFNFYKGQIIGNSSRNNGAGIYLFGASSLPARANLYGGVITDNYVFDSAYNFSNQSSLSVGGAGLSTDNIGNEASIISIKGALNITNNKHFQFTQNNYISTNMSYSTEAVNSFKVLDKLYIEQNGETIYANIGLWGGAGTQLTTNYTVSGNTHADVNKIFFADNPTQAVAYNTLNGEIKYVTANLHTLTYHANNGTSMSSTVSVVDKIVIAQSMFSNPGKRFLNWNTSPDGSGTTYVPQDVINISSNQSLYAIWESETYRIDYWLNGGSFSSLVDLSYTFGEAKTLPTPTWSGKTFEGWYDNPLFDGIAVTEILSTDLGNQTYYAKWSGVDAYTITSTAGANGSITPLGSIIYEGISQAYLIEPMNGYKIATFTVDGIDKKADINNHVYVVYGINANTHIHVTFEKIVASDLTIYATSGANGTITPSGFSVINETNEITVEMIPNPGYRISDVIVNGISMGPLSHYTFNNVTTSQSIHVEFMKLSSTTIFALNLNYNDGTYQGAYLIAPSYIEGISMTLPVQVDMYKLGYNFTGWYDNPEFDGVSFKEISPTESGDKSYWAKWTLASYTITFDSNGGTYVQAIESNYNESVLAPVNPTKLGHTFVGWYSDMNLTESYVFTTMQAESITVYAKWSVNTYTISFDSNGGTVIADISEVYGTEILALSAPTKLGYTFTGWNQAMPTNMPAENITLTAQWQINMYTITFDSNEGTAVQAIESNYNEDVVAPVNPTKVGHTFIGWYSDINLTESYVFTTMPSESITLYAKWSVNTYTISFDSNGGTAIADISEVYRTEIQAPNTPTKLGYTFTGWDQAMPTNMPAENMTLIAQWQINTYTITFDTNGGTVIADISEVYGTEIQAPTAPTKLGYTFIGWDQVIPTNMPVENMTLTAQWQINTYTITFDTNGGSSIDSISLDYNMPISAVISPNKTGYTFTGWDQLMPTNMPAENMTLIAQWTVNSYTITFDSNGGSAVANITEAYETEIIAPANPSRVGYTFTGWDQAMPTNMPAENMTLIAQWAVNSYTITFDSNGGSAVADIIAAYGTEIQAQAAPTKIGYTFTR